MAILGSGTARVIVDGVTLNTFAHAITERTGLTLSPGLVGDNLRVPGRDGSIYRPYKEYDEGRMILDLLVSDVNADRSTAPSETNFRSNLNTLLRLFGKRHGLITVEKYDDSGLGLVNYGEVTAVLSPEFLGYSPNAKLRVEITFPDPLWKDVAGAVTVPDYTPAAAIGSYALTGLSGGTAPINDAVVIVQGPATSVNLADENNYASGVYLNRALTASESWRINVGTFESVVGASTLGFSGGSVTSVIGDTIPSGKMSRFLSLTPSSAGNYSIEVTVNGRSAATRARVQATRRFFG